MDHRLYVMSKTVINNWVSLFKSSRGSHDKELSDWTQWSLLFCHTCLFGYFNEQIQLNNTFAP